MLRTAEPTASTGSRFPASGLGVPCREAQADGLPCTELRADCADCEKGKQAESLAEDKEPTPTAKHA